jgi:hypothetical protein
LRSKGGTYTQYRKLRNKPGKTMKNLIKWEELAMFTLSIYLFSKLSIAWWWFPSLLLAPDLGAIGYLFGNKTGAITYNLFHHKGLAILLFLIGIRISNIPLELAGIILFGHSSMDRLFGYGLKYFEGFGFTHLGKIGKQS